jgi:hypothetical protein
MYVCLPCKKFAWSPTSTPRPLGSPPDKCQLLEDAKCYNKLMQQYILPCTKIKMHGKVSSLPCVWKDGRQREKKICSPLGAQGSPLGANGGDKRWGKNNLPCAIKNARQTQGFAVRPTKNPRQSIFFYRAPYIKRTTKIFTHDKSEFSHGGSNLWAKRIVVSAGYAMLVHLAKSSCVVT